MRFLLCRGALGRRILRDGSVRLKPGVTTTADAVLRALD